MGPPVLAATCFSKHLWVPYLDAAGNDIVFNATWLLTEMGYKFSGLVGPTLIYAWLDGSFPDDLNHRIFFSSSGVGFGFWLKPLPSYGLFFTHFPGS